MIGREFLFNIVLYNTSNDINTTDNKINKTLQREQKSEHRCLRRIPKKVLCQLDNSSSTDQWKHRHTGSYKKNTDQKRSTVQ